MNNKGADQTARVCRLVCAFVVRKLPDAGFLATRPFLFIYLFIYFTNNKNNNKAIDVGFHSTELRVRQALIKTLYLSEVVVENDYKSK